MNLTARARSHAALGDERRLRIVDQLGNGDRTFTELAELVDMPTNLLAHHLDVLDESGLIERRVSEGDHRRRYVTLLWDRLPISPSGLATPETSLAFICTHNSARSQFAAAMWRETAGGAPISAGTHPSERVHPKAVRVAAEFGVDIGDQVPTGYDTLPRDIELVISVCDRAREAGVPDSGMTLHWAVPDPVEVGTLTAFRSSFDEIARRVARLASYRP